MIPNDTGIFLAKKNHLSLMEQLIYLTKHQEIFLIELF